MEIKDIFISVQDHLKKELVDRVFSADAHRILEDARPHGLNMNDLKPQFMTNEQIAHLKRIGCYVPPINYKIYIGDNVEEVTEREGGVELPSRVLYDDRLFRDQVLYRIKSIVGSLRDN
jgi:hypothetical protein